MPRDPVTFRLPVLLATAGVSACASLGGPPPALHGKVVDADGGAALPHVLVMFEGGPEVRADGNGDYTVEELRPGRYRVLVVAPGCRSAEGEVVVPGVAQERGRRGPEGGGAPVEIRVGMPPAPTVPGEVPPPDESRGRVVIDEEIVGMGVARLSEVVRRVAPEMVGAASGDPGRPAALRGRGSPSSSGQRVPVLVVDGIVVHAVDTSALDEISLGDVAWIEILPGAVSGWEYGTGGAGGVIRVQTKRGYRPDRDLAPEHCAVPEEWQRQGASTGAL